MLSSASQSRSRRAKMNSKSLFLKVLRKVEKNSIITIIFILTKPKHNHPKLLNNKVSTKR